MLLQFLVLELLFSEVELELGDDIGSLGQLRVLHFEVSELDFQFEQEPPRESGPI